MKHDWQKLIEMTQNEKLTVQKVKTQVSELTIEGNFELPPLARLSLEDQVFISTFVSVHGSIKEMERVCGVSYPTIKSRLKKITQELKHCGLAVSTPEKTPHSILEQLENSEINIETALKELETCYP